MRVAVVGVEPDCSRRGLSSLIAQASRVRDHPADRRRVRAFGEPAGSPARERQSGAPQTVDPTAAGAKVGQKVTSSFEVASVDPTTNILWVTLQNGTTKPINFDEKSQARLMTLSPGVVVSATYTESAAIQLEKLAR